MSAITPKQELALAVLLTGASEAETSRQTGIGRHTLRKWRTDPAFARELAEQRAELWRQRLESLAAQWDAASAQLRAILDDATAPPGVKVRAAQLILELSLKARDQYDLAERVHLLEEYHHASHQ